MQARARSEADDVASPHSSEAPSFSSDRTSTVGAATFQMPANVRPAPAYIAASVASQTVTDHHNALVRESAVSSSSSDDTSPPLANAIFSEQALALLNGFLDHLLFAFLATARSPSLTAIRPAIIDVLKARLAREAMATADEELQGLLAGDDDDDDDDDNDNDNDNGFPGLDAGHRQKWDEDRIWKRTRLRIMVYTRLGELEDEDEERYVQQERGLSMDKAGDSEAGLVSWASTIFLTSVIESIAEQTLLLAGEAAFSRASKKLHKAAHEVNEGDDDDAPPERIIVEDFDVEKIALNAVLGRLWRTWRKRARTSMTPLSPRSLHYMSSVSSLHRRKVSHDTVDLADGVREIPEQEPTETEIAANIALPMGDNDVNEIEVPGLAPTFEEPDNAEAQPEPVRPARPTSVILLDPLAALRRRTTRARPLSLPLPEPLPFVVPSRAEDEEPEDLPFQTPMERPDQAREDDPYILNAHDEDDSLQEGERQVVEEEDDFEADREHDADMVAFAASTGMGFGMSSVSPLNAPVLRKQAESTRAPPQAYSDRTQVLQSKRMSIEKTGPPGIIRTYSSRSSSMGSPARTPTGPSEPRSFLDDAHPDDDYSRPEAIGVARTSNVPIPSPSPPSDSNGRASAHGKHPSHGGYVEVLPRQLASSATQARGSPAADARLVPAEAPTARREAQRTVPTHKDGTIGQQRVPDDVPSKTRLSSLQEVETWSTEPKQPASPERTKSRGSPKSISVQRSASLRVRDSPVFAETSGLARHSNDDASLEKDALKHVSSSSSTARSVSTSILRSARDSDGSLGGRPRGLSGRMSEEDRQRNFDSLVKGDETVKYTLTPQTVRDADESPLTNVEAAARKPSGGSVFPRVTADRNSYAASTAAPARTAMKNDQGPIPSSARKSAIAKPMAREPRIQNESMQDLADFIRSTGPPLGAERRVEPAVASRASDSKLRNTSASSSAGGLGRKPSKRDQSASQTNLHPQSGLAAKPRIHMEPRSPAGPRRGNDDLIDFIRQGPPGANNGQPRIPRNVAPFRTTVDSDQFERMLDENGKPESTYGSQVSNTSKQSAQTVNSRTGLLPGQDAAQPASKPVSQPPGVLPNEPVITRTRRRVKDPYAIDSDEEKEEEEGVDQLSALPTSTTKSQSGGESMLDFLNNGPPPSTNQPQAFLLSPDIIAGVRARTAQPSGASYVAGSKNNASARRDAPRISSKPRLQARGATTAEIRTGKSATNDLADFLRNSGPPEPAPQLVKKEEKRGSAKFWRKRSTVDA